MQTQRRAYVELHIAVLLFGFTAILGDLISISAVHLVWWRVALTSLSLVFFRGVIKEVLAMKKLHLVIFLMIGITVGVHWICFFGSVKLANASVALICMSTSSLFTALLEPAFLKERFHKVDILFGLAIIPAMIFTLQSLDFSMYWGAIVGIVAAILAALFAIFNKIYIKVARPVTITFLEMFGAWLVMSLILTFMSTSSEAQFWPVGMDWIYLLILALGCTTLAFMLNIRALHHLSAFAANFAINMEPVYGILLAIVILKDHEELNAQFYIGVAIITILVFIYPTVKSRK
jgi:drug/metabolite transporter (DMT)-like permease